MTEKYIEKHTIFKTIVGSRLYGTHFPDSDQDEKGVCILEPIDYLGPFKSFNQDNDKNRDVEIYDIKKFMRLLTENNPNILDLLWSPRKYWLKTSSIWEMIVSEKEKFLSKKVASSYLGYASGQIRRMKTHRSWLMNQPDHQPTREEFGLKEKPVGRNHLKAVLSVPDALLEEGLKEKIRKEKKYQKALANWNSFLDWKKNRNPERAKLEAKIFYDPKHGMHSIRLLRVGKEILQEGEINVDRRGIDADELKEIRSCQWPYEKLMDEVEKIELEINELREKSTLPEGVDTNFVDELCTNIIQISWNDRLLDLMDDELNENLNVSSDKIHKKNLENLDKLSKIKLEDRSDGIILLDEE